MNLNEFFFFKVFKCYKDGNNKLNPGTHNEKNCYFYHVSHIYENGMQKEIQKDRRRKPISFPEFFKKLSYNLKEEGNRTLSFETIFEFKNDENNLNYYIDSFPFLNYNEIIYNRFDCCHNETEFLYHVNRYKKNDCRFLVVNGKCNNKFCYLRQKEKEKKIENEKNKNEDNIDEGIINFKNIINNWKEKKEIKLKEIIDIYNYILSFDNKYLSKIQINETKQEFIPFQKWYNDVKIPKDINYNLGNTNELNINYQIISRYGNKDNKSNERILQNIYNQLNPNNNNYSRIYKNSDLFKSLKINNNNLSYISNFSAIKLGEVVQWVYALMNSSDGYIVYGADRNNLTIKGISLDKKDRDDFKKWFNTEFFKLLIEYEDNLKYEFHDLANNNNDECVLIIEVKKVKANILLRANPSQKCFIIDEKSLDKKNKILYENNILEIDTREYLKILRERLLVYYSNKFGVDINNSNLNN